jgi:hypothetical protein
MLAAIGGLRLGRSEPSAERLVPAVDHSGLSFRLARVLRRTRQAMSSRLHVQYVRRARRTRDKMPDLG